MIMNVWPLNFRLDKKEILDIENKSFEFPYEEDDFMDTFRFGRALGGIYRQDKKINGFIIYEFRRKSVYLWNLAVHPDHRRQGIGASLVNKLVRNASSLRDRIIIEIRETNLPAQLFLRKQGFKATKILKNFYDETPEDAYKMELKLNYKKYFHK